MSIRNHTRSIGLLVVWATLIQAWVIVRNPVPAQDAVGFIQFARQLDYHSLNETLHSNTQHPLYPVLVWAEHFLLSSPWSSSNTAWIRSAQLVAALAFVLLVVPMYLAGIRLTSPYLSTAAVALFTTLPVAARMGADALADSTYLLFMVTSLWGCVEFFELRRCGWLFMAGLSAGIGYLSRPEALLLPLALWVTLLLQQVRRSTRMRWSHCVTATACAVAGLLCVAAPYSMSIGKLTPKRSLNFLPGGESLFARFDADRGHPATRTFSDGQSVPIPGARTVLPAPSQGKLDFALNHRTSDKRLVGYWSATLELSRELIEGLHYIVGFFALIGLFCTQRKPANLFCSMLAIISLAVLVQFASKSGYVSSRHVIALVCLGCYVATRGGWMLAGWLGRLFDQILSTNLLETRQRRLAIALFMMAALVCLPRTLGSLHQSREGHVAAGRWLSEHAATGAIVLDSRGWASLYSGLPAYDYNGARLAFENPDLAYVVVESGELADDRPRGETLRHLLGIAGQVVAEFPIGSTSGESVKVFAWHAERMDVSQSDRGLKAN